MFVLCLECGEVAALTEEEPCMACKTADTHTTIDASNASPPPPSHPLKTKRNKPEKNIYGIPHFPKRMGVLPNSLIRCALFTLRPSEYVHDLPLFCSARGLEVHYTGRRLGQNHFRLYQACLGLAQDSENSIFEEMQSRIMKRAKINVSHSAFKKMMSDICNARIKVCTKHIEHEGGLLHSVTRIEKGRLRVRVDLSIADLLLGGYTRIDMVQNKSLETGIAKLLHPYLASVRVSKEERAYALIEDLKHLTDSSQNLNRNQFPARLKTALRDMKNKRIIAGFKMEKTKISYWHFEG